MNSLDEEFEIKWKVVITILLIIIAYIFGYIHHKFTNEDTKLVKQFQNNFIRCSAECHFDNKIGYITMIDNIHYKCVCGDKNG